MCAAFFGLGSCVPYFWNSSAVAYGEFGVAANWQNNTIPGNGDCAYITPDPGNPNKQITVVISAGSATISNITFLAPGNLIITGSTTFTVTNDLRVAGTQAFKIRVDAGATLNIGSHFDFANPQLSFSLFGTVTTAAIKSNTNTGGFANDGPSSILVTATGSQLNVIDSSFTTTANTFVFAPAAVHTFYSTNPVASNTITFNYAPTFTQFMVKNDYFNPAAINWAFNQGANFIGSPSGGFPIASVNATGTKGTVSFAGSYSLSLPTTNIDATPTFTGSNVVINGGVLTFTLYDGTFGNPFGTLNFLGNGGLSFVSNAGSQVPRTITIRGQVNVYVPTFSFTRDTVPAFWTFNGNSNPSLNFYNAYTIPTVYVFNIPTNFFVPVTVQGSGAMIRAGDVVSFWDGLITSGGTQVWNFSPTLKCNTGVFNFSGAFTFTNGMEIQGCEINAGASQINVGNSITVTANSTIDLNQVTLNYTNLLGGSNPTYTFIGSGTPAFSLFSLSLKNFPTAALGSNLVLTATNVDVIINTTLSLASGSMTTPTQLAGSGQFTLNGGLNVANFVTISAAVAFPSGSVVIGSNSQTSPATWTGRLLLRNSVVTGTGSVNFQGSINILNGVSNINTNNFILNGPLTVSYLANYTSGVPNFLENPTLIFNAGSQRTLQFGVTAQSKVNVIFSDALSLSPNPGTGGVTFTSTATAAAITFNQSPTITIALNGQLTDTYSVNGNTFFNASNVRISNNGLFTITGNVTTQGNFNNPGQASDAVINLSSNLFIVAVSNTVFGPSVIILGTFTTDDNDRNTTTALTTVSFNTTAGTLAAIPGGTYTFFTNVTFLGNTFTKSFTQFNGVIGFLQFNGNCFLMGSDVNIFMRTIFNTAVNVSANAGAGTLLTLSLNAASLPNQNQNGAWFNGNVLINIGISLSISPTLNVYFLNPLTVSGTGSLTATGTNFIGNGPVTISPRMVTLNSNVGANPLTFLGSPNTVYTISPTNSLFNLGAVIVANVPVTYVGGLVSLTTDSTIPVLFTFSNATVTFTNNGGSNLRFSGTRTLASNNAFVFNNLATVTFESTVTINNPTPFSVTGATQAKLVFLYDVVLGQGTTIALNVDFGIGTNFNSLTVSGNTLTLTGANIGVFNNIVFANNGAIASNRPGSNLQTVTGTRASFTNTWSFNTPVNFAGTFNFTSAITFSQNHVLLGGSNLNFPNGLNFATVATALSGSGRICIFGYLNNTNSATTVSLAPGLDISVVASPFSVVGSFIVNSTFTCRGQTLFSNNIVFGFANTLGTANALNLNDNCQWLPAPGATVSATLYRTNINLNNPSGVSIFIPVTIACLNGTTNPTVSFSNGAQLSFFADVTVSTVQVQFNGAKFGAVTIINTINGALIQNIQPTTLLTFNSNPTNAEPIVSFFNPPITQPINLLAPIQINNANFGGSSQAYSTNGQGRLDIGNAVTVSSTVMISVQTNLFLTTNTTNPFTVDITSASTTFTLNNLTLNSPFGFPAPRITFTAATNSIIRFATSGTLNMGNVIVNGPGTTSFRTGTFNVIGTLLVNPTATFWQDLATVTTTNVTFAPAASSTGMPSIYQVTFTNGSPAPLTTTFAVYGGSGQALLSNFAPTAQTTAPVIIANGAAFGNVLSPVTGTPGYSYSSARSGTGNNGLSFVITPNQQPTNAPTQSNGPAPPVSAASSQFFSYVALFISFAVVFISLC